MPVTYHMTWVPASRRWTKKFNGKWYAVSCKKLGVPETKEGSWRAANAWWEEQQKLAEAPAEDDRVARAAKISRLVKDFASLDDAARKELADALLGDGAFDRLKTQADSVLSAMEPTSPERTVAAQVEQWKAMLRAACQAKQLSEGRFDAYCRKIRAFVNWIGPEATVESIDEARLEGFYAHLSEKVAAGDYSPSTAHEALMTAKQFISRLAELKLILLPGNIRSRRFRFNHSAAAEIEVFTVEEVRALLEKAGDRLRLCFLLMLNCGMYQNDIAELKQEEVDWKAGTITRRRSKTRERGGPMTKYKLWPETFELLKRHRSEGELALTTSDGNPLVKYWMEDGKMRRYDAIQSAFARMGRARLGMKHLRKTSSTLLGTHPHYKFFTTHFLSDSPKGMSERHYTRPNDAEFFEALEWLRGQVLG